MTTSRTVISLITVLLITFLPAVVVSAPISLQTLESKFLRAAQFSRVAYCTSAAVTSWKCGGPCDAIGKGVKVIQAGGDDGLVPMYFVAHDPSDNSIVVAHQGTDPGNFLSILNDAQFFLEPLNTTRFASSATQNLKVHDGFQKTFERTADGVLAGVRRGMTQFKSTKVRVTGHSLGAAIATLDSLMLKQALGKGVDVKTTVFGMPRAGNQAFANFVDTTVSGASFTRITNQDDPVPLVPPQFLGFRHATGEVHINKVDKDIITCTGQEDENCSAGHNIILDSSVADHLGPYFDNISFSGDACPV